MWNYLVGDCDTIEEDQKTKSKEWEPNEAITEVFTSSNSWWVWILVHGIHQL